MIPAQELVSRYSQVHRTTGGGGHLEVVAAVVSYLADGEGLLAYADREFGHGEGTGLHFEALFATEGRVIRLRTDGARHVWLEAPRTASSLAMEVRLDTSAQPPVGAAWSAGDQKPEIIFSLPRSLRFDDAERVWIWAPPEGESTTADPLERVRMWRRALSEPPDRAGSQGRPRRERS